MRGPFSGAWHIEGTRPAVVKGPFSGAWHIEGTRPAVV